MHIVQLLPALEEGGVERGMVEISRELVRRGVRSTVISAGGRLVSQIEAAGGCHVCFDVKSKNVLSVPWRVWRLRALLARLNPDIIHVRSRVPAWLAHFANRRHWPVVATVHGFNSVSAYSRIMTRAERVICGSRAVVAHVQRAYGTSPEIIRLIPRGIDTDTFDPARLDLKFIADFRARHRLTGHYVVLAVGRITALKGYDDLLKAVAMAAAKLPPFKLVIVGGVQRGQEAHAAALQELTKSLKLSEQVVFAGSQKQVAEIYHLADLVVSSTTLKPETFGRTMIEALAMERPVIATAHGGALDIISEGVSGWLYPPGDVARLAELLVQAPQRQLTGLRAYVQASFSLSAMIEQNIAIYRELLS